MDGSKKEINIQDIPDNWQRLFIGMQRINFGRIEGLEIKGGEPLFEPPPIVKEDLALEKEEFTSHHHNSTGFVLKKMQRRLWEWCQQAGDITIEKITVANGMPMHVTIWRSL